MNVKTRQFALNTVKTLALPVIVMALFALLTGGRSLNERTLLVTLQQSVLPIIISLALIGNLTLGMFDFSAGAVVVAASIIGGNLAKATGTSVPGLVLFCVLAATALASLTGFLNNKLRIPVMVLTLGLLLVYEALPRVIYSAGATISINMATLALAPWIFVVLAVVFATFYVLYNFTTYGHNIRALGGNEDIARTAGLDLARIKQIGFTISGIYLGVAAVLNISSQGQILNVAPLGSLGTMFSALIGVFLAFFLARYCNLVIAVVIGTFTMATLTNGFVAAGMSQYLRDVMGGIFLVVLLVFSANQTRFTQWRIDRERVRQLKAAGALSRPAE
jgi:ribose transport system permease protein